MAPRPRIADRPHFWTIGFSILALGVSLFGAWQNLRTARVAEKALRLGERGGQIAEQALALTNTVSRSLIEITSGSVLQQARIGRPTRIRLTIQNFGKVRAHIARVTSGFSVVGGMSSMGFGGSQSEPRIDITPGFARTFEVFSPSLAVDNATNLMPRMPDGTFIGELRSQGIIEYFDDVTPEKHMKAYCIQTDPSTSDKRTLTIQCDPPSLADDAVKMFIPNVSSPPPTNWWR